MILSRVDDRKLCAIGVDDMDEIFNHSIYCHIDQPWSAIIVAKITGTEL